MRVTIYTPTKNRKEALAKAIDSVLNQTYQDVEMIVVNDGSTDGTAEYLEGRAKLDSRLKQIIATTVLPVTPVPVSVREALTDAALN